jgi:hypothetical protein
MQVYLHEVEKMVRIILVGLLALLALALSLSGCCAEPSPAPESQATSSGALSLSDMAEKLLYENSENGISITYPSGWLVVEPDANDEGIVAGFLAPDQDVNDPAVYILLQIEEMPAGQEITLEQYGQAALSNLLAAKPNLQVLTESDIPVGGQPGHAIVYELDSEGESYRVLKAWSVQGDAAYIFTYNAPVDRYAEFAADASQIIGSLNAS